MEQPCAGLARADPNHGRRSYDRLVRLRISRRFLFHDASDRGDPLARFWRDADHPARTWFSGRTVRLDALHALYAGHGRRLRLRCAGVADRDRRLGHAAGDRVRRAIVAGRGGLRADLPGGLRHAGVADRSGEAARGCHRARLAGRLAQFAGLGPKRGCRHGCGNLPFLAACVVCCSGALRSDADRGARVPRARSGPNRRAQTRLSPTHGGDTARDLPVPLRAAARFIGSSERWDAATAFLSGPRRESRGARSAVAGSFRGLVLRLAPFGAKGRCSRLLSSGTLLPLFYPGRGASPVGLVLPWLEAFAVWFFGWRRSAPRGVAAVY